LSISEQALSEIEHQRLERSTFDLRKYFVLCHLQSELLGSESAITKRTLSRGSCIAGTMITGRDEGSEDDGGGLTMIPYSEKATCFILLVFTWASLLTPCIGQDSSMFRADAQHSGVYQASGPRSLAGLKWKFNAGGELYASPTAADGMIFIGSTNGDFFAVDQETGKQKWKFITKGRIVSSAAVVSGTVYFVSYDSCFYALNESDGKLKWKFSTEGEKRFNAKHIHGMEPANELMPDPFDFYLSSPVVVNGEVYFGSGDGNVYSLDASTGRLKWTFHTGDVVHASPAVSDGILYVGSWNTFFYAIDSSTGNLVWRFKTGEDPKIHNQIGIQSSAAIADGVVYFGCRDSNLYALDARTGKQRWVYNNAGSWVIGSPAVKDGQVYFTTSDSALLHALDAKSGKELFSIGMKWPMFSSPALAGDMLYIGSHEGKLFAVNLRDHSIAWIFQTDGSRKYGSIYTTKDGRPAYEVAMQTFFYDDVVAGIQKMFTVGAILSSPIVLDHIVVFGSADGNLYAVY
jgi:outer membrane protein assembly factor BamB